MKFWRKPLDDDKWKKPSGEVHIIDDRCKGCGFCIEFCPNDVLIESKRYNVKGYHPPEVDKPESCIACRLCELICPDFSIYVVTLNEAKNSSKAKKATKNDSKTAKANSEVAQNA